MPNKVSRLALIGYPLGQSLSPIVHQGFAAQFSLSIQYEKLERATADFPAAVRAFFAAGGLGLNITAPLKEAAAKLADYPSPSVQRVMAANTLWQRDGALYADSTDALGFMRDIQRYTALQGAKLLILGSGAVVRSLLPSLLAVPGLRLTLTARNILELQSLQQSYPELMYCHPAALKADFDIIIQASSAHCIQQSLDLQANLLANQPFCYDLQYRLGQKTDFLAWVSAQGCEGQDGLGMLLEQAAESFYLWFGLRPDTGQVYKALR